MSNGNKDDIKITKHDIVAFISTVVLTLGVIICYNTDNKIIDWIFLTFVIIALILEFYCIIEKIIKWIRKRKNN